MRPILPGITSLEQHLERLQRMPEAYRPERCPHCGKAGVWRHGHYERKADRQGSGQRRLGPIPIPRFFCAHCQRTCSCVPECLPPRRWYLWAVQQAVLEVLLGGGSRHQASQLSGLDRGTVRRWWSWLGERFSRHSSVLRARFAELGRQPGLSAFWCHCLEQMSLARAMYWVHHAGVVIP